jgi:hypothetical protein
MLAPAFIGKLRRKTKREKIAAAIVLLWDSRPRLSHIQGKASIELINLFFRGP